MSRKAKRASADWRERDPEYARESNAYADPVPSRRLVLEDLAKRRGPMTRDELVEHYGLAGEAIRAFEHRIGAMLRDGQLLENRRGALGLVDRMDLVRGRVQGHRNGFGFLLPEKSGVEDVFLNPRQMRLVMHGDRAVVRLVGRDDRGRPEGRIAEVLERANSEVVGRLVHERGVWFVVPDNARISQTILIPEAACGGARQDQIVTARITEPPNKRAGPIGEVVAVLGDWASPGMEIEIALRSHAIPFEWPDAALDQASALGDEVDAADQRGRVDLRELPLVTIDGADARDFDDAVYARATRTGWRLWVAIADVSAYVEPDSALDAEAQRRGTSVYFPDHVVPMLPEALSNGLCSLNPGVDRLALVCEMRIDAAGETRATKHYSAVMRSHARLTYDQVADWLANPAHRPERDRALAKPLAELERLYGALAAAREARGAIAFETTATQIVFNESRKIERIVASERTVAHKIIEECMIAANVATARYLAKKRVPTLYRVHAGPAADALADLRAFLGERGLKLGGGSQPQAADFARVLNTVAGRSDAHLVQTVLLKSLARAVYTPNNDGHFGLALEHYLHFTSPIRRYPDLLVHRAIKHLEAGGRAKTFGYDTDTMAGLGTECSAAERRADEATRDVDDWLKCEYMRDAIGQEFAGTVVGVTGFGLFVELDGIYVTGLVHVSSLSNDYYHFDPQSHCLRGERSGNVYRLADSLQVRVLRVDLDERKIDFERVEIARGRSHKKPARAGKKRKKALK